MLNLATKISTTVCIVLAVTHYTCAMSAAASQAVAGANAILNNASIPQEYKDMLFESVEADAGVTYLSRGSAKSARFSSSDKYSGADNTKCGRYCCALDLPQVTQRYTKKIPATCYRRDTEYYKSSCGWFCTEKRSRQVTRSHQCFVEQSFYRLQEQQCPSDQYTRCCPGYDAEINTPAGQKCCFSPAGLKAITDFIRTLIEINISPDSPFLNLIGKK